MPIKVVKNTINEGMRTLPRRLASKAIDIAESSADNSLKEIKADVMNNMFWTNRSFNAANSINKEVVKSEESVSASIGFEKGRPNEKDAPGYYKSGRNHEYAEYISDRQETHFLGAVLQSLVRNVSKGLGNFKMSSERATRVKE